jgi:hypothetical protein
MASLSEDQVLSLSAYELSVHMLRIIASNEERGYSYQRLVHDAGENNPPTKKEQQAFAAALNYLIANQYAAINYYANPVEVVISGGGVRLLAQLG